VKAAGSGRGGFLGLIGIQAANSHFSIRDQSTAGVTNRTEDVTGSGLGPERQGRKEQHGAYAKKNDKAAFSLTQE